MGFNFPLSKFLLKGVQMNSKDEVKIIRISTPQKKLKEADEIIADTPLGELEKGLDEVLKSKIEEYFAELEYLKKESRRFVKARGVSTPEHIIRIRSLIIDLHLTVESWVNLIILGYLDPSFFFSSGESREGKEFLELILSKLKFKDKIDILRKRNFILVMSISSCKNYIENT